MEREDSGYVVSLMADENILEAESLLRGWELLRLIFPCRNGRTGTFLSKGKGHGLGFLSMEVINWQKREKTGKKS